MRLAAMIGRNVKPDKLNTPRNSSLHGDFLKRKEMSYERISVPSGGGGEQYESQLKSI